MITIKNKHVNRLKNDAVFRTNITLTASCLWNAAYGVFQFCLGLYHYSFWYCSVAAYYIMLALLRFYLSSHTRKHAPGKHIKKEYRRYRNCGIAFLVMNLAFSLMVFFMVYWDRTFAHHKITTIAMATYTFTAMAFAIINMVKYRKHKSPVISASKAVSLAAACVSMLTLTSTMITAFGKSDLQVFRKIMLAVLGFAVSVFIITMAIYMIVRSSIVLKKLRRTDSERHI